MDNLITGLIAVAVFLAFTIGLAVSIGTLPFILIVILVAGMIITDFYQSAKAGLKDKNSEAP
jgi:F0F1-type ATP synthase assembly protein I